MHAQAEVASERRIAAIGTAALLLLAPVGGAAALQEKASPPAAVAPLTVPEATDYARTSTSSDVLAFVAQCVQQGGAKLTQLSMGKSTEGKELTLVLAAEPPVRSLEEARASALPKVLVFANIHAGEVEGKEAVQILLREIAQGQHAELLKQLVVALVPNYNPDGNDKIDRKSRADQAGPVEGVGQRANGMNLDLNRDYMKGEAPETQALIRTVRALEAMLVMDLHTTDGSYHGYELTYSGIFHPACDPALLEFTEKKLLPELRAGMATRGFATFDYGDFNDGAHPEKGWSTFDCKPRYGTNYFGFQNCLTILSEAYSHEPFAVRIAATRACVLEGLSLAAKHAAAIQAMRAAAARSAAALVGSQLPTGGEPAVSSEKTPVLVGAVRAEKDPVTGLKRLWDTGESHPVEMPVFCRFVPVRERPMPVGWIVPGPSADVLRILELHGIRSEPITSSRRATVRLFHVTKKDVAGRPFQGHALVTLTGDDQELTTDIAAGSLFVPAAQPLARLAFMLLEPESDDGLAAWGFLGCEGSNGELGAFQVLRLVKWE